MVAVELHLIARPKIPADGLMVMKKRRFVPQRVFEHRIPLRPRERRRVSVLWPFLTRDISNHPLGTPSSLR